MSVQVASQVKAITILLLMLCALTLPSGAAQALTSLTACENNQTHKIRFPTVGKSCKSGETAITLDGPGPIGPSGPSGPSGPTGPSGPPGGSSNGPSLEMEGTGALVPTSPTCGVDGLCPGNLTASLTGTPFGPLSLDMDVSVHQTAGPTPATSRPALPRLAQAAIRRRLLLKASCA